MVEWSVKGIGAEVTVVSPEGDVFPFVITSTEDLHLTLRPPVWRDSQAAGGARPQARYRGRHGLALDAADLRRSFPRIEGSADDVSHG